MAFCSVLGVGVPAPDLPYVGGHAPPHDPEEAPHAREEESRALAGAIDDASIHWLADPCAARDAAAPWACGDPTCWDLTCVDLMGWEPIAWDLACCDAACGVEGAFCLDAGVAGAVIQSSCPRGDRPAGVHPRGRAHRPAAADPCVRPVDLATVALPGAVCRTRKEARPLHYVHRPRRTARRGPGIVAQNHRSFAKKESTHGA